MKQFITKHAPYLETDWNKTTIIVSFNIEIQSQIKKIKNKMF